MQPRDNNLLEGLELSWKIVLVSSGNFMAALHVLYRHDRRFKVQENPIFHTRKVDAHPPPLTTRRN